MNRSISTTAFAALAVLFGAVAIQSRSSKPADSPAKTEEKSSDTAAGAEAKSASANRPWSLTLTGPEADKPSPPDPRSVVREYFGGEAVAGWPVAAATHNIECLIVTVPHPTRTEFTYQFDLLLESIQRAHEVAGYVYDRGWFPDTWRAAKAGKLAPEVFEAHDRMPALLLFRGTPSSPNTERIVWLVPETLQAGIQRDAFRAAVQYTFGLRLARQPLLAVVQYTHGLHLAWDMLRAIELVPTGLALLAGCPDAKLAPPLADGLESPVRVVAPYFSGSVGSLVLGIRETRNVPGVRFHLVNGSATGLLPTAFEDDCLRKGWDTYAATVLPDDYVFKQLMRFMSRDGGSKPRGKVAVLYEANTGYGRRMYEDVIKFKNVDESPNRINPIAVPFPVHIAHLRKAYDDEQRRKAETLGVPRSASVIPFPGEEHPGAGLPRDTFAMQSPLTTSAVSDLVLRNIVATLKRENVQYVGLIASDPRDKIFLGSLLDDTLPDVQLFTTNGDLLLTHPDYSDAMLGTLVGSSYPLNLSPQRLPTIGMGRRRFQFSGEATEGVFNAALYQMARGVDEQDKEGQRLLDAMADYYPGDPSNCAKDKETCREPRVWVSVIGRNGTMVPVRSVRIETFDDLTGCIDLVGPVQDYESAERIKTALTLSKVVRHNVNLVNPTDQPADDRPPWPAMATLWGIVVLNLVGVVFGWSWWLKRPRPGIRFNDPSSDRMDKCKQWTAFVVTCSVMMAFYGWVAEVTIPRPGDWSSASAPQAAALISWIAVASAFTAMSIWYGLWKSVLAGAAMLFRPFVRVARAWRPHPLGQFSPAPNGNPSRPGGTAGKPWSLVRLFENGVALSVALAGVVALTVLGGVVLILARLAGGVAAVVWNRGRPNVPSDATLAGAQTVALAVAWIGGWVVMRVTWTFTQGQWLPADFLDRQLYCERLLDIPSGVTPLIPAAFLSAAVVVWCVYLHRNEYLLRHYQVPNPFPGCDDTRVGRLHAAAETAYGTLLPWGVLRNHLSCWLFITGLVLVYAAFLWGAIPSIDGVPFSYVMWAGILAVMLMLTSSMLKFYYLWKALGKLLRETARLPMTEAFGRLPHRALALYSRYLFSTRPQLTHLEVSVTQFRTVADGSTKVRGAIDRLTNQTGRPWDRKDISSALITLGKDAWDISNQVMNRRDLMRKSLGNGNPNPDDRVTVVPGDLAKIMQEATSETLDVLGQLWEGYSLEDGYGGPQAADASVHPGPEGENGRGGTAVALRVKPRAARTAADVECVRAWMRQAEEFVALEVLRYVSQYFIQLRNLLTKITVTSVLLLLAVSTYPLHPQAVLLSLLLAGAGCVAVVVTQVLVAMNRDELVSRVTDSPPNRFTPDLTFAQGLATYVLPIVGVLVVQFPQFFGAVRAVFAPLFRVLS
jgi:hypothetical protein